MRKYLMIVATMLLVLLIPMDVHAKEQYTLSEEEEVLLQQIAQAEAGNQGIGGMAFVMQTIMNRVYDENFPDTVQEVLEQEGQFATYTSNAYLEYQPNENSGKALWLMDILENRGQLYFENPHGQQSTWHSRNLTKVFEYEDHKFYK